MRRLIRFGFPNGPRYKLSLLLAVMQGLSAIALLGTSAWLISRASEQPDLMYLSIAIVGVRTFALSRAALRYAERWLSHDAAFSSLTAKRPRVFKSLIALAPAGFGRKSMGEVSSQMISDVDELQNLPLRVISPIVQSFVVSIASIVLFAFILPSAVPVMAGSLALAYVLALPVANALTAKYDRENSALRSQLADESLKLLDNGEMLLSYGWFEVGLQALGETQTEISRRAVRQAAVVGLGIGMFSLGAAASSVMVLWLGYQALLSGHALPVMLAVFALLPLGVFDVAGVAQPTLASWRKYRASAERLMGLESVELAPELDIVYGDELLTAISRLEVKDWRLGYPESGDVVKGFALSLKSGDSVSLLGSSGAGKTTIALALARLLKEREGSYLINGVPVERFSEQSLRSRIGYLEQAPTIFEGTVRENLAFASAAVSDAEMISTLERVHLWSMFELRGGLDCQLGEQGVLISGGEAQRLAMARALIGDFDLLILDEPTASLDADQAKLLVRNLLTSTKNGKIIVLITHDASLAKLTKEQKKI